MHSSRLRTGWLWLRIGLAHLLPPHRAPLLIFVLVLLLAIDIAKISSAWRQDVHPRPAPTALPTVRPTFSRPVTTPVTRPPTPDPTTTSPPTSPTSPTPPTPTETRAAQETPVMPTRHPTQPAALRTSAVAHVPPTTAPSSALPTTDPASPPTTSPPSSAAPAVLTVTLDASPSSGDVGPCYRMVVSFTGTIAVDRAASVTYRWDPEPPSVDPQTKVFAKAGRKTVRTGLTVQPKPGEVLEGTMRLTASVSGGDTAEATARYSLTCTG